MYDNIQKVLNGSTSTLTPAQQSENYKVFSDIMKEGIYLPDMMARLKELEAKMEKMDRPKENAIDAQLFAVMESAVKDDQGVIDAKRQLQAEKSRIISDLCMADERYRGAFDRYRTAVNAAYVGQKEDTNPA